MHHVLVFTSYASAAFERLNEAFTDFARRHGWRIQVVATRLVGCEPTRILSDVRPDGVLVYCAQPSGIPVKLGDRKPPTVYVNLNDPQAEMSVVRHDSAETGRRAAIELMRLGLSSFGVVGWEKPFVWSTCRCDAFARELKVCGMACARFAGKWSRRRPMASRKALGKWIASLPRPCGILAANDIAAEAVVSAALAAGLSVPEDVSVIGVDDTEAICENAPVTITSIRPDFAKGGWMAAELLARLMDDPRRKPGILTYGDECIVRRGSTRILAQTDRRVSKALEFIRRRACSGIGVADVVREMNCSRRAAELAFRATVGNSILGEINEVRLARAKELLADSRQVIGSIPQKCGWRGANFLMRLFKARTGMTMRAWRAEHAR